MIRIEKCKSDNDCIIINFDGFVSIMSEEEQKRLIDWFYKNKQELM
jgi:hypothetical protein